ncbi:PfkB family carbohydrate kinase [Streptosporangium sp. NPDC051023]|uniref:PfkB family carbohydrate kinase n=1 Tax=Streptosporangium sp. NPDC051023 TaxID=3155410 RepID=UPI00344C1DCD
MVLWEAAQVTRSHTRVTELAPVGAGDAFASGWLAETLEDATPKRRLATACAAGAFAVTSEGDWESFPRRADLAPLHPAGHHADMVSR